MRRSRRTHFFPLVLILVYGSGCDSLSGFDPPRPAEIATEPASGITTLESLKTSKPRTVDAARAVSTESTDVAPGSSLRGIELILISPDTVDRQYLTQVVRKEAGKRALAFRLTAPESGEPMTGALLAKAIRKAAERRHAIIVEPLEAVEVCEAIRVFQATGLGILLLDQPLNCDGQGDSLHRIVSTGFPERGEAIVAAAMDEAAAAQVPTDAPIVIIGNRDIDAYSRQRQNSLTEALKRRNRPFTIVRYTGSEAEAQSSLSNYQKTHSSRQIVLAEDHRGLLGAYKAHEALISQGLPAFILAGYALSDVRIGFPGHAACVAFAYQDLDVYSRKAADVVVQLSRGRSAPELYECELPFVRTRSALNPGAGLDNRR